MTGIQTVDAIVQILVEGITQLGAGIGSGVSAFATSLAYYTPEGGTPQLSVYFILVCVFAGVALCVALTSKIFAWLTSLGN